MSDVLKEDFIERYKYILRDEFQSYLEKLSRPTLPGIRVNTLKISVKRLGKRLRDEDFEITSIPWFKNGFFVSKPKLGLGKTIEHALGYYYVQDPISMLPPIALKPKPGESVLDLCAAPGSKTTQIAQTVDNTGIIVANDINGDRLKALLGNLQRCGVSNTLVTNMDGTLFSERVNQNFDKVLVDAPCSGSGLIRNQPRIGREWSTSVVEALSGTQKKLILSGFDSLKVGGSLVYSTCSLEPEENEDVVNHLLSERSDSKIVDISFKDVKSREGLRSWEDTIYQEDLSKSIRIYPQDNDTIGFFLAKVRRLEG